MTSPQPTAYDKVNWDKLSPYAQQQVDLIAQRDGVTLHAGSTVEELQRFIAKYHRTAW